MNPAVREYRRRANWKDWLLLVTGVLIGPLFLGSLISVILLSEVPIRYFLLKHGTPRQREMQVEIASRGRSSAVFENALAEIATDRMEDTELRTAAIDGLMIINDENTKLATEVLSRNHEEQLRVAFLIRSHYPSTDWHCDYYLKELESTNPEIRRAAIQGHISGMRCEEFKQALKQIADDASDPERTAAIMALGALDPISLTEEQWILALLSAREEPEEWRVRLLLDSLEKASPELSEETVDILADIALDAKTSALRFAAVSALESVDVWTNKAQMAIVENLNTVNRTNFWENMASIDAAVQVDRPLPELLDALVAAAKDSNTMHDDRLTALEYLKRHLDEKQWAALRVHFAGDPSTEIQGLFSSNAAGK